MYRFLFLLLLLFTILPNSEAQVPCLMDELDLTPGGIPNQSSIYQNSGAAIAIDGITDGNWSTGKASRTLEEPNAWWAIDLGDIYALESINIWYPSDIYPEGFADYYILYSRYPFLSTDLATELASPIVSSIHVESSFASGAIVPLNNESAQYVRIQNSGGGTVSLKEIIITGRSKEICDNNCDDDGDGFIDCEDSDCSPTLYNITKVDPSCPICPDGEINIQAFGENLRFSIDGGQSFEEACDGFFHCKMEGLLEGDFNVLVTNDNGCMVEWPDNPVQLRAAAGGLSGDCPNGGFEEGKFDNWIGGWGGWIDNNNDQIGDEVVITNNTLLLNDRHTIINAELNPTDPEVPGIDLSPPSGGKYIAKLGNSEAGQQAEVLKYCFDVDTDNADFSFFFLPVLEDPNHDPETTPFFLYLASDSNGQFIEGESFIADKEDPFYQTFDPDPDIDGDDIVYRTWTCRSIDFSNFIGQEVCILFETADCARNIHFGYTYIDALCNTNVKPTGDIKPIEALCVGSNDGFTIDGTRSRGENSYTWEVCKLNASNTESECFQQSFSNDVGILNIKNFYSNKGGNWECDVNYRVKLSVRNDCAIGDLVSIDVFASCNLMIDYPDFVYCVNNDVVPMQGVNNCNDCDILWQTDLGILDDYTVPFPNILAFPPGNALMELSYTIFDNETRCSFSGEVSVRKFATPIIESLKHEVISYCSQEITVRVFSTIGSSNLEFPLKDEVTGNVYFPSSKSVEPVGAGGFFYNLIYSFSSSGPFITNGAHYTFTIDVVGLYEDFVEYGCGVPRTILVDNPIYYGDFPPMHCPNAFTPNSDGINDEWKVASDELFIQPDYFGAYNATEYELIIFDSFGGELYNSGVVKANDPINGFYQREITWDGKNFNGNMLPSDVYTFKLTLGNCDHPIGIQNGDCQEPTPVPDPDENGVITLTGFEGWTTGGSENCIKGFITIL